MNNIYWNDIKQLDMVLDFFKDFFYESGEESAERTRRIKYHEIYRAIVTKYPDLDQVFFQLNFPLILEKLIRDKYVIATAESDDVTSNTETTYGGTFEGRIFSKTGGYAEEAESSNQSKTWMLEVDRQNLKNAKRLNTLTLILGIGTVGLLLFEIYKFCFEHSLVFVCH